MGTVNILPWTPTRQVAFQGDFDALVEEYDQRLAGRDGQYIGRDRECAALPQFLTDVGHTSRWHRGPRVLDLSFLLPGTVIANFKLINGRWRYPNQSGYHVGLFKKFEGRALMSNGLPCEFSMFDQYKGKPAGSRGLAILPEWFKLEYPEKYTASNRADEFYVVTVP